MDDATGVKVEGGIDEKPQITVPGGEAPEKLIILDLVDGEGTAAEPTDTVNAHYVGVGWDSGKQFDSSWDRGESISFPLNRVIAGWRRGIPGMRPGGRRLLVIPGDLAYGPSPPPGSGIGRHEALVFVVDLIG